MKTNTQPDPYFEAGEQRQHCVRLEGDRLDGLNIYFVTDGSRFSNFEHRGLHIKILLETGGIGNSEVWRLEFQALKSFKGSCLSDEDIPLSDEGIPFTDEALWDSDFIEFVTYFYVTEFE